jgi:hypothetical protein
MLIRIILFLLAIAGAYILLGLMTGYCDYKGPAKHPPKEYLTRGRHPPLECWSYQPATA